jgi:cytochrome c553
MKKLVVFEAVVFVLAACFGAQALAAGDAAAGKQKSQTCAACHGADGNTPTGPDFPRLAGQHYDYLLKALRDYKSGSRNNPIMGGQVGALSTQDMADLAAYFSSQKGALHVIR